MTTSHSLGALFRLTLASGVPTAVALHLRRGAHVNGRDGKGRTPLILAAGRGHAEVCRLLIDAGADPELRDNDGQDALAVAVVGRHQHIVDLLSGVTTPRLEDTPSFRDALPAGGQVSPGDDKAVSSAHETNAPQEVAINRAPRTADLPSLQATAEQALTLPPQAKQAVDDDVEQAGNTWISEDKAASALHHGACRETATQSPPEVGAHAPTRQDSPAASLEDPPVDSFWEAEPEPALGLSNAGVEWTASALDVGLTKHAAQLSDPDWLHTEVVLPNPAPRWASAFVHPREGHLAVVSLLEVAMREGWLPDEEIAAIGSWAANPETGEVLADAMRVVLENVGVIVEAEHALELSREAPGLLDLGGPAVRSSDIVDAVDFIGGLSGGFLDAETMLLDAAKQAPVLSAKEEVSLFQELTALLQAMRQLTARSPSTVSILMRWAEQLEAGILLPKDVIDGERDTGPSTSEQSRQDADESEEADISDEDEANMSGAGILASQLRDAAQRLVTGAPGAGQAFIGLSLVSRRVLELAEGMLSLDERQCRSHRQTPRRNAGPVDLRILRRRPPNKAALPTLDIGSARDRYLSVRETIVGANLRRVVQLARRYARGTTFFLDLVQEGQIGLLRAIDRYDASRGWRFGTYATWWIRQAMGRFLQDTRRTVRIPVHLADRIVKVRRHADAFRAQHGVEPSSLDIARAAELDVWAVERALVAEREIVPLQDVLGFFAAEDDSPAVSEDFYASELINLETPLSAILQADLRQALLGALRKLHPREARVLDLRFGITDGHSLTLEEVGQSFHVTRERIRQIESKALGRLLRQLPARSFERMAP